MKTLSEKELGRLMMLLGAVHDIAEKTRDEIVQRQLNDVRIKMEKILVPENDRDTNN